MIQITNWWWLSRPSLYCSFIQEVPSILLPSVSYNADPSESDLSWAQDLGAVVCVSPRDGERLFQRTRSDVN